MADHLTRKHAIAGLDDVDALKNLIQHCALREVDARILYMVHVEGRDQNFIADTLGMSVQNMRKRYYAALTKLYRLARLKELL